MLSAQQQYALLKEELNERQWRIFLGTEARKIAYGGISKVARLSGSDWRTVKRGAIEVGQTREDGRVRVAGGGRKSLADKDTTLLSDLESLLQPKGDPMTLVKWTTKSLKHLVVALSSLGHSIKKSALADVLHTQGFSLKAARKNIEGESHPDRDLQFDHINKKCKEFELNGDPIISVDCKKKELIGNFKNGGREWQPKGQNTSVNVYDFSSLADGKAVPYGVYDAIQNKGFVNVGTDHDTASFAVESIRRWWKNTGRKLYLGKKHLLITCDGGGSNGVRNRLWKKELQELSNESQLAISVCHFPPATSKWNRIEHRLFSYISVNWRAKPLTSLETIIELISSTTTETGLTVRAIIDENIYPTGIKVTDEEMERLNIIRDEFHGEWNYTIRPQQTV